MIVSGRIIHRFFCRVDAPESACVDCVTDFNLSESLTIRELEFNVSGIIEIVDVALVLVKQFTALRKIEFNVFRRIVVPLIIGLWFLSDIYS